MNEWMNEWPHHLVPLSLPPIANIEDSSKKQETAKQSNESNESERRWNNPDYSSPSENQTQDEKEHAIAEGIKKPSLKKKRVNFLQTRK